MSDPYEEIVEGERVLRLPPGVRHEVICQRLHAHVAAGIAPLKTTRLLPPRSMVELATGTMIRPDLTLVTVATGKIWLVAEVISKEDHQTDTVMKKLIYESSSVPRLWMVDPRYNNVEIYHGTPYGLALKNILGGRDLLTEDLIPILQISMADLFGE